MVVEKVGGMNGKTKAAAAFTFILILISLGTVFYHFTENWSYVDSLYYSTVTLITVNYGDIAPQTQIARLFTVFYVLIGASLVLAALAVMTSYFYDEQYEETASSLRNFNLNMKKKQQRI